MLGKRDLVPRATRNLVFRSPASVAGFQSQCFASSNTIQLRFWPCLKFAMVIIAVVLAVGYARSEELPALDPNYVLDYKDTITVVVLRHDEFGGTFIVPQNGWVVFPGSGELMVKGKSLAEMQSLLTEKLSARLRHPEVFVSLHIARPRLVYVIGNVAVPGSYNLEPNWRVSEVLAVSGGLKMKPERAKAFLFAQASLSDRSTSAQYFKAAI